MGSHRSHSLFIRLTSPGFSLSWLGNHYFAALLLAQLKNNRPSIFFGIGARMATINLKHVTKRYGALNAMDDVSLEVKDGDFSCAAWTFRMW